MKITVIGAGSWGTTLALLLQEKKVDVSLWVRSEQTYLEILGKRKNSKYTLDTSIPKEINIFHQADAFPKQIDVLVFAVPSEHIRQTEGMFHGCIAKNLNNIQAVVNVAKGIEPGSCLRPSQILKSAIPEGIKDRIATMSGPNISREVLQKMPSVTVMASENEKILASLQQTFSTDYFRVYTNDDLVGVETGGAVKNIIAIAAGISDGLHYGANAKASLITRGLYEMAKYGTRLGARSVTFSGAAGMGDLVATCISPYSRNRYVGEKIAQGFTVEEIKKSMYMVAEGIKTTKAVYEQALSLGIEMPVTESLYRILYEGVSPMDSVNSLMKRKFKPEIEF